MLQCLDVPRILDRRFDPETVANNSRIGEQPVDVIWLEGGDAVDFEIREGSAECRTLFEDRQPG
jgi:hypothetical protein